MVVGQRLTVGGYLPAGGIQVVAVSPAARSLTAPVDSALTIQFDRPVNPATIDQHSFWALGKWSGTVSGTYSFSPDDTLVTLSPDTPFSAGEQTCASS